MKKTFFSAMIVLVAGQAMSVEDVWPVDFSDTHAAQLAARSPSGDAVASSGAAVEVDARGAGVGTRAVGKFDSYAGLALVLR